MEDECREVTVQCNAWQAVHDFQPPGPPRLRVTGECILPTPGHEVELCRRSRHDWVVGRLGGDPRLESGCAWLDTGDGERYEVLWPDGYRVEFEPLRLLDPDGQVLAGDGDRVGVSGRVAPEVVTVCMAGTPYRAERVAAGAGRPERPDRPSPLPRSQASAADGAGVLVLERLVRRPDGFVPQVPTRERVSYEDETDATYEAVLIVPDGITLQVQKAH